MSATNLANFLRDNSVLKQRDGSLQTNTVQFFRFKRCVRALLSQEYKDLQKNPKNQLPAISNEEQAKQAFITLIKAQLLIPAEKLSTAKAKELQLHPKKGLPCFQPTQRAELKPDEYYVWLYKKKNPLDLVYGALIVIAIFTLILFPLWPMFMRKGVWYLSVGALGLIGLFFVIAIIRLIIFVITYFTVAPGLWIYPNLFADCGFFDSFKPMYEWNYPKEKKAKKAKGKAVAGSDSSAQTAKIEEISSLSTSSTGLSQSSGKKRINRAKLEEVEE